MAAVGLPCWTPGVWDDTLWTLGVWRDPSTPVVVEETGATPGLLTPQQIARLRGYQAPARQGTLPDAAISDHVPIPLKGQEGPSQDARVPTPEAGVALLASVATETQLYTQALALADLQRRQALVANEQALAEDEEALALLLFLLDEV